MEKRLCITGRDFVLCRYRMNENLVKKSDRVWAIAVLWKRKTEQDTILGIVRDEVEAIKAIGSYFRWSFCSDLTNRKWNNNYPWHIRRLADGKRNFLRSDTNPICGKVKAVDCEDLVVPVSLEQNDVCDQCAALYWELLIQGGSMYG